MAAAVPGATASLGVGAGVNRSGRIMCRIDCLILPHENADGPANMARDEAMLDLVASGSGRAAFRTYGWTQATLSLGYFQSIREVEADARWRGVPLVRRPTGGGALLHDIEITYALVIPRSHPVATRSKDLYRCIHEAIAGTITRTGPLARRRGEGTSGNGPKPFLCFSDRDPEDVVVGSVKVVGSAQRRRSGAVLQHGSLLLQRSVLAPELVGLGELSPISTDLRFWSEQLREAVPAALGLGSEVSDGPDGLRARADELEREVYRNPAWTRRR